jgi:hypothetical protein
LWLAATATPSSAFVVVPLERDGEYLKWGPSLRAGTHGGIVTWGILAADTPGSSACGDYCAGTSLDRLPHFYATPEHDNRTTSIRVESLQSTQQAAFDAWSAVADIQFQYLGIDHSLRPIDDPAATSPMIRVGAFAFGGVWSHCLAGAAFAAPPNVGSVAGDIFLNANVGFQLSTAPDDSELAPFPLGNGLHMTDLYMLALHEIGHAIGLGGSSDPDSVLCDGNALSASLRTQFLWRKPKADDVAGAVFLYGPPRPTTSPESGTATQSLR